MRISDSLDFGAIDGLIAQEDGLQELFDTQGDLAYLDLSLKKLVKKAKKVVKKAGRSIKKVVKQPQRLLYIIPGFGQVGYLLKRNKKLRGKVFKGFAQAAPFIQGAAQILNLIVPGLGIAIGLGITAATTTMAITQKRQMAKLEKREEEKLIAEERVAMKEADEKLMAAYDKGAKYFTTEYDVTRLDFQAASIEDRTKFLNLVIYDKYSDHIQREMRIGRDQFQAMKPEEQAEVLATVGSAVPNAPPLPPEAKEILGPEAPSPAPGVPTPEVPPELAPLAAEETPWTTYALIGGGILAVGVVVYLAARSR